MLGLLAGLMLPSVSLAEHENGVQLFERQQYEQAASYFRAAHEQSPDDPLVNYYLGRLAYEQEEYDQAVDYLKVATKREKTNSDYHLWLGRSYLEKLQNASFFAKGSLAGKVRSSYEKAVKLDSESVEARLALGSFYLNAPSIAGGSKKKAKAQAQEIMSRDPKKGRHFMAAIYVVDEKYEEAAREYESYLVENPEDTETLYDVGMLYQKMERYQDATDAFDRAVAIDPGFEGAWYQIGRTAVFWENGLDHGIAAMLHFIENYARPEEPYGPGSHWRLGMLYELKGDPVAARASYQEALRMDPEFEQALEALEKLEAPDLANSEGK
jgi:tetratricopeptide (TPR) repeat protein